MLVVVAHSAIVFVYGVLVGFVFQGLFHSLLRNAYEGCVGPCKYQFVIMYAYLHGVSHGCELLQSKGCTRYHSHVQEVLTGASLSSHFRDDGLLSYIQFVECHVTFYLLSCCKVM